MEIILLLFVVVLIAVAVVASRMSESYVPYPYKMKDVTFCSAQEAQFLTLLDKAVSDDFRIFTKVRLSDLVSVKSGLSRAAQKDAQTKASQRILDYVLCDIDTMEIKAVIELEPASPQLNQQKRNLFLKNALGAAGLPFLRFKAQPGYRVAELKQYIHAKIQQAEHIKAAIPGDQQRPATGENHGKHGHESPIAA
ncbi:DUF2726 domain-containing protein [uncultured Idiomarina sp.]|uniref:DUF2726 domain-containing protein n=2 Tax=Idiomarina TaxID=135575 RepID=UPI000C58C9F4|nr:hypothetical protein [Idiomarinaceae bacterium]|tara:strand:+ start:1614 stop:2198 length:585 start_codon:yes stop_codon:yes gene_type:complete